MLIHRNFNKWKYIPNKYLFENKYLFYYEETLNSSQEIEEHKKNIFLKGKNYDTFLWKEFSFLKGAESLGNNRFCNYYYTNIDCENHPKTTLKQPSWVNEKVWKTFLYLCPADLISHISKTVKYFLWQVCLLWKRKFF